MRRLLILAAVLATPLSTARSAPCDTSNVLAGRTAARSADVDGNLRLLTDGAIGSEGEQWNAPTAVTMRAGAASITFDLGEPRALSAFYMQGDANDTYTLSGSLEDAEESFQVLGTFANVLAEGPGLRSRTLEIAPRTVRYLRVAPGEGDGFFSITELAAYCQKPSPFPPVMRGAAAPEADAPPDAAPRSFMGLYGLGLLALLGAALALRSQRA